MDARNHAHNLADVNAGFAGGKHAAERLAQLLNGQG
jgi:hypothetical protein